MIKWLVNKFLKEHVNQLVDLRLNEKIFEKNYERRQDDIRRRIAKVRQSLHSQTSRIQEDKPPKVLSSNNVQTRSDKSRVSPEASKAQLVKRNELDSIKAKLMGKNNV